MASVITDILYLFTGSLGVVLQKMCFLSNLQKRLGNELVSLNKTPKFPENALNFRGPFTTQSNIYDGALLKNS